MIADSVRRVAQRKDLTLEEMKEVMGELMDGGATDVQKAALLVALRMKGETTEEIAGAVTAMRERVIPIDVDPDEVIDTCGTGGDGKGTFNVSTVAAFVAAGAGIQVAKHGNRAVSSSCGSADVLRELGVNIDLDATAMTAVLRRIGIAFLFAPKLHPATAAVVPVRRELGMRTIFNLLGPLTNPAFARRQVLGIFDPAYLEPVARVLRELGSSRVMVVHSSDGLDEISIAADTRVCELRDGELHHYSLSPEDLGLSRYPLDEVQGGGAAENAGLALRVLEGGGGACREIVLANAGAAIYVGGATDDLREAVELARESLDSGRALEKLQALISVSAEEAAA